MKDVAPNMCFGVKIAKMVVMVLSFYVPLCSSTRNVPSPNTWRNAMLNNEKGKIGWILLWALGVPIPILLVLYFLRGCT
jgi:hypothetical protein